MLGGETGSPDFDPPNLTIKLVFPTLVKAIMAAPSMKRIKMLRATALILAALLLAPAAWAHTEKAGDLQVVHPWVTPAEQGGTARVHPTLVNQGEQAVVIERASSPVAGSVAMRRKGKPVDTLTIAAGETLTPDGVRFELQDLKTDLPAGKAAPITLHIRGMEPMTLHLAIGQDTMNPDGVVQVGKHGGGSHATDD